MQFNEIYFEWQRKLHDRMCHKLFKIDGFPFWEFIEIMLFFQHAGLGTSFESLVNKQKVKVRWWQRMSFVLLYTYLRLLYRKFKRGKKAEYTDVLILLSDRFGDRQYVSSLLSELDTKKIKYEVVEFDRIYLPETSKKYNKLNIQPSEFFTDEYVTNLGKYSDILNQLFRSFTLKYADDDSRWKFVDAMRWYLADIYALPKAIIESIRPKVSVVINDTDFYSKSLIHWSNVYNLKTIALQYTDVDNNDGLMHFDKENRILPTIKCARTESDKKKMVEYCNYPEERIHVTGDISLDRYYSMKPPKKVRNETLVYCPAIRNDEYYEQAFKHCKGKVVFKLHPMNLKQSKRWLLEAYDKFACHYLTNDICTTKFNFEISKDANMIDYKKIIMYPSGARLEAKILGKKPIIIGEYEDIELNGRSAPNVVKLIEGLI